MSEEVFHNGTEVSLKEDNPAPCDNMEEQKLHAK
jgi:hypothetical protein